MEAEARRLKIIMNIHNPLWQMAAELREALKKFNPEIPPRGMGP